MSHFEIALNFLKIAHSHELCKLFERRLLAFCQCVFLMLLLSVFFLSPNENIYISVEEFLLL